MTDIRKGKGDEAAFDADYDFSSMDWGNDGDGDKPSAAAAHPAQEDPFGNDEDAFSQFASPGAASGLDDDRGEEFSFDSLPDPRASSAPAEGNADHEFSDISADGSSADDPDPFDMSDEGGDPFVAEPSHARGRSAARTEFDDGGMEEDPFASSGDDIEQAIDDGGVEDAAPPAQPAQRKSFLSRMAAPVGLAAVALLGYVGYDAVFVSEPVSMPTPRVVAEGPKDVGFPTTLPPRGQAAEDQQRTRQAAPMQVPPGVGEVPAGAPAIPALTLPELPMEAPRQIGTTPRPQSQPQLPPPALDDDLVGGNRGGIAPIAVPAPEQVPVSVPQPGPVTAASDEVKALERQVEALQRDFAAMRQELASLGSRLDAARARPETSAPHLTPGPVASPDDRGQAQAAAHGLPQTVVPPLKPAIVEGVSLKGVSVRPGTRDVAWVSTKSGVVEVAEGDEVPQAGKVVKLRPYGGDWIMVTTKGVVTR